MTTWERSKMTDTLVATMVLLATFSATNSGASAGTPSGHASFVLSSPDPQLVSHFPDRYVLQGSGCTGGNESPPLRWRNVPAGTRSFVVTLFDRDEHSTPSGWWHWIVYNIPGAISELPVGAGAQQRSALPQSVRFGRTDLGTNAYHGPCPDKGDAPHRYAFTIYALDVATLDVPPDSSGAMVVTSLRGHLLGSATMTIHHGR